MRFVSVVIEREMGSFDGDQICEVVGICPLEKLLPLLGKEKFGLYKNDGLATVTAVVAQYFTG